MENLKLIANIESIGCTKAEAETFALIAQYPDGISVLALSRALNIPRPTIYSHLENLMALGIVKKGISGRSSLFYTENLESIQTAFNEKISALHQASAEFAQAFGIIEQKTKFKPRFFVFEGPHAAENIFRDILSTKQETFFVWPVSGTTPNVSSEQFLRFHKERIRRGIWMNSLWPALMADSFKKDAKLFLGDEETALRKVRLLPAAIHQDIGYAIYGTKVAFISLGEEDYSFIVESKRLSETMRSQFDFIWNIAKPIPGKKREQPAQ